MGFRSIPLTTYSRRRGMTLTEVMITATLLSLISAAAFSLLMMAANFQRQAVAQTRCKNEAYTAVETISRTVREGSNYAIYTYVGGEPQNEGSILEVTNPNGTTSRFSFEGSVGKYGMYNNLYMIPNTANPNGRRLVAQNLTPFYTGTYETGYHWEPYFRAASQNRVYINFRVGDRHKDEWDPMGLVGRPWETDVESALNSQSVDVRTIAVMRNGSRAAGS